MEFHDRQINRLNKIRVITCRCLLHAMIQVELHTVMRDDHWQSSIDIAGEQQVNIHYH